MSVFNRLFNGQTTFDFMGYRKRWYAVSGFFIALSLLGLLVFRLNAGIDFTGGDLYDFRADGTSVEQVQKAVTDAGVTEVPRVTQLGTNRYRVETTALGAATTDKVSTAIKTQLKATEFTVKSTGATWGAQVSRKALESLIIFLVAVFAYISFRFEWRMAVGALAALGHDLVITAGIYALTRFEVTPSTVIALLTILGYSLYDTVVVFDKLRENSVGLTGGSRMTYSSAANLAMNQTLMRSINTSLTGLIPVGAILFVGVPLGATTLKDLGLALFIGLISSTYSSIFFATPIVVELKEREPQYKALAARVLARQSREGTGPVREPRTRTGRIAATDDADVDDGAEAPAELAPTVTTSTTRQAARPARPAKPRSKGGRPSGKKRR
ncbi:MAG: preprotein translocase subunit SecF [Frankiaceae bacterium]|jgi:preprotein translocase subunit SecF|nr:preprotein translocase subunit SecF [Frankiaceae bacterium]